MKKNFSLSMLIFLLFIFSNSSMAGKTFYVGYVKGNMAQIPVHANGFSVKYQYEDKNLSDPLSGIISFSHIENQINTNRHVDRAVYYGFTLGPMFRLNSLFSVFGTVGIGYANIIQNNEFRDRHHVRAASFCLGQGLKINLTKDASLYLSYERSRFEHKDCGMFSAGLGYKF